MFTHHDCLKLLFLDCKDNPKDLEIVGFGLTGADQSVKELGDFSQLTTFVDGDVNGKRFQMEMIKVREVLGFKSKKKKRKGSHDWTK